ncbi:DUF5696 domain-containing protein [Natronobacillus azotifigens]|uniref:DUF5696 domain-containing protein n=1 Tax=Natronobacillus azotifigens TaxID=472978 RepID=A0A9J6R945_9BACI|nr:DUF5696 domain-containing protein [Natronobacillus azotifigens]MCZ0702152.1 DUF5696 domain-containing protein [Natronobacillus azotifigens]
MVKIKTVIKLVLFIAIIGGFVYVSFSQDDGDLDISDPGVPPVDLPGEDEDDETDDGLPPIEDEPDMVEIDEDELEELEDLPMFIDQTQEEIRDHVFFHENDQLEMYLKEENLSLILRDKNTGALMYSTVEDPIGGNQSWTNFMQSGVVLEYITGRNLVTSRADMYSEEHTKEVTKTDDGFVASIMYAELEIGFDLHVTLTEQGITVDIPKDSIVEDSDTYKVGSFYVYPFMGHTLLGERDGYMFIPDGSGALIHLDDKDGKFRQPYSVMIYGANTGLDDPFVLSLFNNRNPFNDPENILAPVFGMVHTDNEIGFLGIVEEGQYSARIEAYPNGAILPYNWITTKFIYRQVYSQPTSGDTGTMVVRQRNLNDFDIKVHFNFVTEDNANYMGLAASYRDYLLDNDLITVNEDDFNVRIDLLGAEVEQGLIFKKDVPMTTFSQAYDILTDIQAKGANNILSIYKGWNNKGPYGGLPIRSFNPESILQDGMDINELIDGVAANGVDLFLYHDALRINMEELGNTTHRLMRKYNRRTHREEIYGNVYREFNWLHPRSTVNIMETMINQYERNDIENLLISGISNELFSYSEGNREFDRITTKNYYEPLIQQYNENFHLLLEQPFSYLWNQTEAIIDLPISSSDYVFVDEDIPFIALTLSGIMPLYAEYANFQANQERFFLQLVEQGLNPSFLITHESPADLINTNSSYIYSSQYERYEEMIQEYYRELEAVHNQTAGAFIVGYDRQGGVTKVTYDNGVEVFVNYQEQPISREGHLIEALSYKVVNTQ